MNSKAVYVKNLAETEQLKLQIKHFFPRLIEMFQVWDIFYVKDPDGEVFFKSLND